MKRFFPCVFISGGLALASIRAATYTAIGTIGEVSTQTSGSGPQFSNQYRFSVRATGPGALTGDIYIQGPNGSFNFPSPFAPDLNVFPSREALAQQFPSGTYDAKLSYRQTPTSQPVPYVLSGDATLSNVIPPAPEVIGGVWDNGVLLAGENDLSVTVAPWIAQPAGSFIGYTLGNQSKSSINSPSNGTVFSGLQPGTTYSLDIMYMNPENTLSVNLPPIGFPQKDFAFLMGGSSITRITVRTVPEPSIWQLSIIGALFALGILPRKLRQPGLMDSKPRLSRAALETGRLFYL